VNGVQLGVILYSLLLLRWAEKVNIWSNGMVTYKHWEGVICDLFVCFLGSFSTMDEFGIADSEYLILSCSFEARNGMHGGKGER